MHEPTVVFQCDQCQKTYSTDYLLRLHRRRVHASDHKFVCNHCNYSSNYKYVLTKHITRAHSCDEKKSTGIHSCPLCDSFKLVSRCDMLKHYESAHSVPMSETTLRFGSDDDFETWKSEIESRDSCQFVVSRGERKTSLGDTKYLRCSRDGFTRNVGKCKRTKLRGSIKTNAVCPSSMNVRRTKSGVLQVKYIATHVGHTCDVGRRLSRQERNIAQKLSAKIPVDAVLDSIRESVCNVTRLHHTRKDLMNVKRRIQDESPSVLPVEVSEDPSENLEVLQGHENPIETTVEDLSAKNRPIARPEEDITKYRELLRVKMNRIIDSVQTFDDYQFVLKVISPLPHNLDAQRSDLIFSSTGCAAPNQINPCVNKSPQKCLISTKKKTGNQNRTVSMSRPSGKEEEDLIRTVQN